jgi:hypothetical protein
MGIAGGAMSEYRLFKCKEGRCSFAKVAVRATRQVGPSRAVQAIPDQLTEGVGEVNMASCPSWVSAAVQGAAEALAVAEQSGRITGHYLVEVTRVVGLLVDTTEDAVQCAAAVATWQTLFPTGCHEARPQLDPNTKGWSVEYPAE